MRDYSQREQAYQVTQRINATTDPYEIIDLVLNKTHSAYYRSLKQAAATAIVNIVRQDGPERKSIRLKVVNAVLEMVGRSNAQSHQELGCNIFWRLSVDPKRGEKPLAVFVHMIDEIEEAVSNAIRMYKLPRVGWVRHAESVLHDIQSIRASKVD